MDMMIIANQTALYDTENTKHIQSKRKKNWFTKVLFNKQTTDDHKYSIGRKDTVPLECRTIKTNFDRPPSLF